MGIVLNPKLQQLCDHLQKSVLGSQDESMLLVTCLLARGHALLDGPPGVGKTSLAQSLANQVHGAFRRVQFTPDLLPSDILGYQLYKQSDGTMEFIEGPIFSNIVLADEINRASPRVQSALLESMSEGQVSVDGKTRVLEEPFMVVATQNGSHYTGTYPLPEPQLDRFLMSIPMSLPDKETQLDILLSQSSREGGNALLSCEEIVTLQNEVSQVGFELNVARYVVELCESLRELAGGDHTLSVRASLDLKKASQAYAFLKGESHVYPDHVKFVLPFVMSHRVFSEDGSDGESLVRACLMSTEVE